MPSTREYRIETRHGFYSAFEKIGGHNFPARYDASFQGATVYDNKAKALTVINRLRLSSHIAYLHEVDCLMTTTNEVENFDQSFELKGKNAGKQAAFCSEA